MKTFYTALLALAAILTINTSRAQWLDYYLSSDVSDIRDLESLDSSRAILCGVYNPSGSAGLDRGVIMRSMDDGDNWTSVFTLPQPSVFNDIQFYDSLNGFAAGAYNGSFIIAQTTDGGATWDTSYTSTLVNQGVVASELSCVWFHNTDFAFLGTVGNGYYRKVNGGVSWSNNTSYGDTILYVQAYTQNQMNISVKNGTFAEFYYSTNNALTFDLANEFFRVHNYRFSFWDDYSLLRPFCQPLSNVPVTCTFRFHSDGTTFGLVAGTTTGSTDIEFLTDLDYFTGTSYFAVGGYSPSSSGTIILNPVIYYNEYVVSAANHATQIHLVSDTTVGYYRIAETGKSGRLFAAGKDLISITDNYVGLQEKKPVAGFKLFPNPANNRVQLSFDNAENRMISIYDMSGKLVLTAQSNDNKVDINTSALLTGMYMVHVRSDKGVMVEKLLLK